MAKQFYPGTSVTRWAIFEIYGDRFSLKVAQIIGDFCVIMNNIDV